MTKKKQWIILFALIVLYAGITFLPTPEGLTVQGKSALALMLCCTIAMALEVLPVEMIAFLLIPLQAILGIATLPEAMQRFAQPTLFFAMGIFMVALGFQKSGLDKRVVHKLTAMAGSSPKKLLFYFMMGAGIASTVLSDMMVVIVLAPLAISALKANGCEPGKSNLGRCMMIGIPVSALIGGCGTPLGSIMNVIAQSMIQQMTGVYISFLDWLIIGMPIVLLVVPLACKVLMIVYPIEIDTLKEMDSILNAAALGKMNTNEKKFILLFGLMVLACSTEKLHGLSTAICAMFFALLMLLFDVITWEDCQKKIGWPMMIALFCITALGSAVYATGASDWISQVMASAIGDMGAISIITILGIFTIFIHLLVPVNMALISILIPISVSLAGIVGIDPVFLALVVAFCVHISILLPLDAIPLLIFPTGYYKMYEMFKPGLIISIGWLVIIVVVLKVLGSLVGI